MLFVMTAGDLNIDVTQKSFFFTKVVGLLTKYQLPVAVCRYDSWFSRFDAGPKGTPPLPARFRAFQSPPRIGLSYKSLPNIF